MTLEKNNSILAAKWAESKVKLTTTEFCQNIDKKLYEEIISEVAIIKGDAETLAGLLLEITKKFPKRGQKIKFEGYQFIIEEIGKFRIKQVKVSLPKEKRNWSRNYTY